ncbi:MAG: hypothetical protein D6797_09045 [Bdellovibrio sp.]|nr:MAG: hypothetical protein D6797_09045 [Bdellovibrio sp.]
MKKLFKTMIGLCVLAGTLTIYNSCQGKHNPGQASLSQQFKSLFNGECVFSNEEELFLKTYYPVVTTYCQSCHSPGGRAGFGRSFAAGEFKLAYESFSKIGYAKITKYASSSEHYLPAGQPQVSYEAREAQKVWERGVQQIKSCGGELAQFVDDIYKGQRIVLKNKPIDPQVGGERTITWNLNSDMLFDQDGSPLPNLPGAQIQLSYSVAYNEVSKKMRYEFFNPVLKNAQNHIQIKSLLVHINGAPIKNQTTFKYVDAIVRKGTAQQLSLGYLVAEVEVRKSDFIGLSIGELNVLSDAQVGPPPQGPQVNIVASNLNPTVNEDGSTFNFQVKIDNALNQPDIGVITVQLEYQKTSTAQPPCCMSIQSYSRGETIQVPNYDMDFDSSSLDNNNNITLVFIPPYDPQTVSLKIKKDQRDEANEKVVFAIKKYTIDLGTKVEDVPSAIGPNNTLTLTILDNDAPPAAGEVTLTQLMEPGGVFRRYCVNCHNPDERQNGQAVPYVMTDYENLVDSRRVVPGNPMSSLLYRRLNPYTDPNDLTQLQPMPLNGPLSFSEKRMIELWLKAGAKNN